ncbi:MAG: Pr6Pr family membrane protein [Actinomycetales bacterium]
MTTPGPVARAWWSVTALAVVVAFAVQIPLSAAAAEDALFPTPLSRVLNLFAFFTIWSNLLVGVVTARLALGRGLDGLAWRTARLASLVGITVTFVVYNVALRGLLELSPIGAVANELFHSAVPALTVVGWLVFGPRQRTSWRVVAWTPVLPITWLAVTLVRGAAAGGVYPYPFLDVAELGVVGVALNVVLVGGLFLGLAVLAHVSDVRLSRRPQRSGASPAGAAET